MAGDAAGYPNGRRLTDDVIDIALRAVACGYGDFLETNFGLCNLSPNNLLGDGVDMNDDNQVDQMDGTPCLCEKKYQITLLRLDDGTTHREKFFATDRYAAVAKAFKYFAHKPQADCLDTWKVYDATEVEQ